VFTLTALFRCTCTSLYLIYPTGFKENFWSKTTDGTDWGARPPSSARRSLGEAGALANGAAGKSDKVERDRSLLDVARARWL